MIAQLISPSRTFLFVRRYVFEYARVYGLLYLAIAAFLILWLGVHLNFTNPMLFSERVQVAYYFVTLFLAGCLSAGVLFSELGSKTRAIHYHLIPASSLEKFITSLLFGVFVFLVMCSAIFFAVDYVAVTIANYKYDTHWEVINLLSLNKYPNPFFDSPLNNMFCLYFPIQAVFLLCSVYFRKYGLFKAIVAMGLLWVVFIAIFLLFGKFLPVGMFSGGLGSYEVIEANGDNKLVSLSPWLVGAATIFFKFLLTPILWASAYFRLKEKEL